jgi:pilus assembly protein CpaF
MNTGHEGSMSTLHSNSPRDTLSRLETMVLMAGMELPSRAIREQISSALDMVIHIERLRDGTRKVTSISEVLGVKDGEIELKDIYKFQHKGFREGMVQGSLIPTGYVPLLLKKMEAAGVVLPEQLFSTQQAHK